MQAFNPRAVMQLTHQEARAILEKVGQPFNKDLLVRRRLEIGEGDGFIGSMWADPIRNTVRVYFEVNGDANDDKVREVCEGSCGVRACQILTVEKQIQESMSPENLKWQEALQKAKD